MEKKLYRIEQGKMLCGVCGGLAEYLNLDPSVGRLLTVLRCLMAGSGVIAYIAAALIMPVKPN